MNRCAIMRKFICCWNPASRAAACSLPAFAAPMHWTWNWQRLILTHLAERSHPGVLAGAPLTDVKSP